ncbi:type II toxin-antitoxin system RelE family toxin [Candidatus Magnetominusculus dajiuhuensis]|uniref:type II toxin-antitoxin system RelE family toxin n=1 Tax=Candidatus Magnetominusculus dajiuhuensis TaxID=3137712 RepID=UPI0019F8EED1|nr:type II toxin-antitoxin system RelE/ParE family toxin [Nitrospirota bacterium]
MFNIEWTEDALRDLDKIERQIVHRILKKTLWLSMHFHDVIPECLSGDLKGAFKLRVGDWRLIYTVDDNSTLVIQAVGHRRDIYR